MKKPLHYKTWADLRIDVGKELSDRIIGLFTENGSKEGRDEAIIFFYSPMNVLAGYSLSDLCKYDMRWIASGIVDALESKSPNLINQTIKIKYK